MHLKSCGVTNTSLQVANALTALVKRPYAGSFKCVYDEPVSNCANMLRPTGVFPTDSPVTFTPYAVLVFHFFSDQECCEKG